MSAAPPRDIEAIRHVLSRATGTGWEAAYRQDVGALLDEVERLRAEVERECAAVVAFLRDGLGGEQGRVEYADDIERGEHRRKEEE